MTRTDRTISSAGMGAPDWDTLKGDPIANNDVIPNDGWIYCKGGSSGRDDAGSVVKVMVNGLDVVYFAHRTADHSYSTSTIGSVVPVSKGDIVTIENATVTFYPCKN